MWYVRKGKTRQYIFNNINVELASNVGDKITAVNYSVSYCIKLFYTSNAAVFE